MRSYGNFIEMYLRFESICYSYQRLSLYLKSLIPANYAEKQMMFSLCLLYFIMYTALRDTFELL